MSTKKPWFPLYAADFLTDTQDFTPTEVGIYFRLLAHEWINGGLPADEERLRRLVGAEREEWTRAWLHVTHKFEVKDGRLYNNRLERERARANKIAESKSRAGKASAEARKKTSPDKHVEHLFESVGNGEPTQSNQSQSQSQLQLGEEGAAPPPARPKQKHQLPKDWQPSPQLLAWAKKEAPKVNVMEETKIFRDHFLGSGNPKIDWNRTWQVWMRKEQKSMHRAKRQDRWTLKMAEDFCIRERLSRHKGESNDAFIDRMRTRSERGPQ